MEPTKRAANIIFSILLKLEKRNLILNLLVLAVLVSGVTIVFNNYHWYDKTIVNIEKAENTLTDRSKASGKGEKYFSQAITGTIMNGDYQGEKAYLSNRFSSSNLLDDQYKPGDEVFAKINANENGRLEGYVTGLKRDKYTAILASLLIWLLIVLIRKKGLFFIISLVINIASLGYALHLNHNGLNILTLSNCLVLIFTFISLLFICGINRKAMAATLSTLITLVFTMVLFQITLANTDGIDYTYMEYIAGENNLSQLFLSQILIGSLGAIMDVAVTEASALNELILKNPEISAKELIQSGREVGYDIMGTMINIMLFAYLCGAFPLIILRLKNNIGLNTIILSQLPMELYRFLIGSIGILLAIPITVFISILTMKKGKGSAC
jgi:uncharacterized membrane protein